MAEAWRTDLAKGVRPATAAPDLANDLDLARLPEHASPANNPALNRSAEAVGRGVGNAVAGVRRLPQQIEKLRSKIHLVPGPALSAEALQDSALHTVAEWRDAATEQIAGLKDEAERYAYAAAGRANHSIENLKRRLDWRVDNMRRSARHWLREAKKWEAERPLQVIAGCAALAFVVGVALRVRRNLD